MEEIPRGEEGCGMTPCPICHAPTPAQLFIEPLAIQCQPPGKPILSLFRCHGATRVDPGFLRFGIIDFIPYSCGNTRWYPWNEMGLDLRQRSLVAEEMRLALKGWI
jgi:hypothetical protein